MWENWSDVLVYILVMVCIQVYNTDHKLANVYKHRKYIILDLECAKYIYELVWSMAIIHIKLYKWQNMILRTSLLICINYSTIKHLPLNEHPQGHERFNETY